MGVGRGKTYTKPWKSVSTCHNSSGQVCLEIAEQSKDIGRRNAFINMEPGRARILAKKITDAAARAETTRPITDNEKFRLEMLDYLESLAGPHHSIRIFTRLMGEVTIELTRQGSATPHFHSEADNLPEAIQLLMKEIDGMDNLKPLHQQTLAHPR